MTFDMFIVINTVCCGVIGLLLRNTVWWKFVVIALASALIIPQLLYLILSSGSEASQEYAAWEAVFTYPATLVSFLVAVQVRLTFWLIRRYQVYKAKIKK